LNHSINFITFDKVIQWSGGHCIASKILRMWRKPEPRIDIFRDALVADLLDWESLYAAGRLHKPVRMLENSTHQQDEVILNWNAFELFYCNLKSRSQRIKFIVIFWFNLVTLKHKCSRLLRCHFKGLYTRYFCTQYCYKKILQYLIILFHRFQYPTKVSSEKNVTYHELRAYLGQKKPVAQKYLFIAILCAKISSVYKPFRVWLYTFDKIKVFTGWTQKMFGDIRFKIDN